jgi:hypothetical protein
MDLMLSQVALGVLHVIALFLAVRRRREGVLAETEG